MEELEEQQINKRPTFLKVLCYISFFVSGYVFFGALVGVVSGFDTATQLQVLEEAREENLDRFENLPADDPAKDMFVSIFDQFETYVRNTGQLAINDGVLALVTLLAVSLMYRGHRKGFYLYAFTAILGIVLPQIIASMPFLLYWRIFAYGLFVGLYATQFKHLRLS